MYPELRQKAKAAGFAIQYGGNGYTIANNLGISQKDGDKIYETYCDAFNEMFDYFDKVSEQAIDLGYITFNEVTNRKSFIPYYEDYLEQKEKMTPAFWEKYKVEKHNKSVRYYEKLKPQVSEFFKMKSKITRLSYNYPVQGTSADITKIAAVYFFNYLIEANLTMDVKICNIVHDEIVVECSEDMAEIISEKLKYCMEKSGKVFCKRVPLKAQPQITKVWDH